MLKCWQKDILGIQRAIHYVQECCFAFEHHVTRFGIYFLFNVNIGIWFNLQNNMIRMVKCIIKSYTNEFNYC